MERSEQDTVRNAIDDHQQGSEMAEKLVWDPGTQSIVAVDKNAAERDGLKYNLEKMGFAIGRGGVS